MSCISVWHELGAWSTQCISNINAEKDPITNTSKANGAHFVKLAVFAKPKYKVPMTIWCSSYALLLATYLVDMIFGPNLLHKSYLRPDEGSESAP